MPRAADAADLSRVWDLVALVREARSTDEIIAITHRGLLELLPCDSVSFTWVAPGQLHSSTHPSPGKAVLERFEPMLASRWRENPLAEHFRRTADSRPLTWADVTDVEVWRASAFFSDFYVPLGVWDQLGIRIPSPPGAVGGLVANSTGTFTERDRAVLGLVGGHIAHHLHVVGDQGSVDRGLHRAGWDIVSVDHDQRVVAAGGRTAVAVGCRPGEPLPIELAGLLEVAPGGVDGSTMPPGEPRSLETAAGPVVAFVVPGWPGPHTVFLRAERPGSRPRETPALLLEQGLTTRQGDVALLLADGQSNQRIASLLGISIGTVKKHCQQVFVALDVDNRAAAAAALVRLIG